VPLFTSGGLGLRLVKQRSWSWSCYFGLGLKNLVLFTSLAKTTNWMSHLIVYGMQFRTKIHSTKLFRVLEKDWENTRKI